jgi:hypothetical protein
LNFGGGRFQSKPLGCTRHIDFGGGKQPKPLGNGATGRMLAGWERGKVTVRQLLGRNRASGGTALLWIFRAISGERKNELTTRREQPMNDDQTNGEETSGKMKKEGETN